MGELLLTFDSATSCGSVALTRGETLLGEILLNLPATHSESLLTGAQQLLADAGIAPAQLDALAVVRGPGSFTGLRVGLGTVQGLALALDRPVVPVSSLATLALNAAGSSRAVWALLDARKGELYACRYDVRQGLPCALGPEEVIVPALLVERLAAEPVLLVGSGVVPCRPLLATLPGADIQFLPAPFNLPRAAAAAVLALDALRRGEVLPAAAVRPVYIRPSEAEIAWEKRCRSGGGDCRLTTAAASANYQPIVPTFP